jgi:hypothetical protein
MRKLKKDVVFSIEFTESDFPGMTEEQYEDIGEACSSAIFDVVEKYGMSSLIAAGRFVEYDHEGNPVREPMPLPVFAD